VNYFVDTNVLVYARDLTEADKQTRAHQWLTSLWRNHNGRLSYQVLQEYYVTVTRKLSPGMSTTDAREDIRALMAWRPFSVNNALFNIAWDLQDQYCFSWWDSLIVAAAQALNCEYLLTEDLQHGQQIGKLTVLNPFLTELSSDGNPIAG
jgi:predicted nucleic acid-binding protein